MPDKKRIKSLIRVAIPALMLVSCAQYDNFTTYFNTYYNAERLLHESENEFEYQDEKRRVNPRIFVVQPEYWQKADTRKAPVVYMSDFVIDGRKLQPVKNKLDSILIKGSKILAKHPKSNYVEPTLLLMAQAYFYQSDWINCQVKCSELIDKFPDGDLTPDAHLMIAKTYLIRKKNIAGMTILSRTVDVAWKKKRYDILSEAFRLEAELAMFEHRFDDALRPYRQAIAQCEDSEQRARWQVDMAALLYRSGKFERAAKAFKFVNNFSPDYATKFESKYYYALCQIRLGNNKEGMDILDDLYDDGKYEEWRDYVTAGRMLNYTITQQDTLYTMQEKFADSAYSSSPIMQAFYFEKGMSHFEKKEYEDTRKYLAQVRNARADYFSTSNKVYNSLTTWSQKRQAAIPGLAKYNNGKVETDDAKYDLAGDCFEYGRVHEILGNQDSALYYYEKATMICPKDSMDRAQYLFGYQRLVREENPMLADSLYEVLADFYPKTEYGKDAFKKLGYTEYYTIDTVGEIYSSGNQLRQNGLYDLALQKFEQVYTSYPDNKLAPKSIYSIGWVYENNLHIPDSALTYYSLLLEKYPDSEYAKDVKLSVSYLQAVQSGTIPDSLREKQVFLSPKRNYLAEVEAANASGTELKPTTHFDRQQAVSPGKSGRYLDELKKSVSPSGVLDNLKDTKEKLTDKNTFIPEIKFTNPLESLKKNSSSADSSSTKLPALPAKTQPVVTPEKK